MDDVNNDEYFVIKDRCKTCKGRICEGCVPLANRISGTGDIEDIIYLWDEIMVLFAPFSRSANRYCG